MLEAVDIERSPQIIPGAYLDRIDLQHPINPKNPRRHVWLASTDEVLSLGIVIDRGRAVIASLDEPHVVGVDSQEVKISISDFMDPEQARITAEENIRQWMLDKIGPTRLFATEVNPTSFQESTSKIQDLRKRRPQEILSRIKQSSISLHVYVALYNVSSQGFIYRYVK